MKSKEFLVLASVLSASVVLMLVLMLYASSAPVQQISAQSPIQSPTNTTIFPPINKTLILQSIQPYNITFFVNNTKLKGVVTIPDLQVLPDNSSDIVYYTCEKKTGQVPMCTSEKGNVADGIALYNDRDTVCKGGAVAYNEDNVQCNWNVPP